MTTYHTTPAPYGVPPSTDPATVLATVFAPFREVVSQWVADEMRKWQLAQKEQAKQEQMMTRHALRAEFDICTQTVRNWEKEGILNPLTVGRRVFYSRPEVLTALKARTKPDGTRLHARRKSTTNKTR
ncbi:hypothetical protein [Hymenobacter sediminicola]|uniref:Uncharacterized protein n=1 Tax=Hymenobacter sediminicola TaxID=2761579 RepID=A0A7G7W779_9BACT|nr:hypothetical protein [Hymenobacter sediminicola]QNH62222.1 hypothetical protein H4317_19135 [Hymenobacter sediminicola]